MNALNRFAMAVVSYTLLLTVLIAWPAYVYAAQPSAKLILEMQSVQEYLERKAYRAAVDQLSVLRSQYVADADRSLIYRTLGYAYVQLNDTPRAERMYKEAMKVTGDEILKHQILINLNYALLQQEKFQEVINLIEEWLTRPDAERSALLYYVLARAYVQSEKYSKAMESIQKSLAMPGDPQRAWLQLAVDIYLKQGDYKGAIYYLTELLKKAPAEGSYWRQLASVYQQHQQPGLALATLQLAFAQGVLTQQQDVLDIAGFFAQQEQPWQAAKLLEEVIERGAHTMPVEKRTKLMQQIAYFYAQARDDASAAEWMQRAAREDLSTALWVEVAKQLINKGRWLQAEQSLDRVSPEVKKGEWFFLRAVVAAEQAQWPAARAYFLQAEKFEDYADQTQSWLAFIEMQTKLHQSAE